MQEFEISRQELRHFADNSQLTISELSKFIEIETDQKYLITQKDFVKAISKQLFNNTFYIIEVNQFINDNWIKLVKTNQETADKWKEFLKVFED
jgi:tetraacyldisaccharide-1-P 4'-kinase